LLSKGFRGEALPTIASVSRFCITSRTTADDAAVKLQIDGGRVAPLTPAGAPVGTCVEVRDLLWNVPARLKFLKSQATEAAHISDVVTRAAMAHPSVHFRLRHDGRVALDVARCADVIDRAKALLPARVGDALLPVFANHDGIAVTALLAPPEFAQTTARGVQLYVDSRAVKDRGVLHAVTMGYGELVDKGRYPLAIVFVNPPVGTVDYNVHPQKTEVRFSDPGAIHAAVRQTIRHALAKSQWVQSAGAYAGIGALATASRTVLVDPGPNDTATLLSPATNMVASTASSLARRYAAQLNSSAKASHRATERAMQSSWGFHHTGPVWNGRANSGAKDRANQRTLESDNFEQVHSPVAASVAVMRYIGQLDLSYLLCESNGDLVIVDQQVASQAVTALELHQHAKAHSLSSHRLLLAITMEMTAAQLDMVVQSVEVFRALGFEVEPWGTSSVAIKAVPTMLIAHDHSVIVGAIVTQWQLKTAAVEQRLDSAIVVLASQVALRAGEPIDAGAAQLLLQRVNGLDVDQLRIHGKLAFVRMTPDEILKRFSQC
jgi:DNA mismatch repair protein MutL